MSRLIRRFAERHTIVSLAVLMVCLALTACGATGIPTPAHSDSVPTFASTPGTAASQGAPYTYQIATSTASGAVNLALTSAPSGTTLQGNTLAWTPVAAQSRVPNQFSLTATNSAGSATQTWSVTPTGTISGSWIDTNWTASGPVAIPLEPRELFALVPQADGTFSMLLGTGNPDGTFSIPNVPGGYYWLQLGPSFYWTSSSSFDFGFDTNSQMPTPGNFATTSLVVNFIGLDPWQQADEAVLLWPPFSLFFVNSGAVGMTSLSTGAISNSNINFSLPSTAYLLQYEPESFGSLSVLMLGSEDTLPGLSLMTGTSNTINGTLAHSPQNSFDLNVKGSAWPALFNNVGPVSATLEGADLEVTAQPSMGGGNVISSFAFSIPLLVDPQQVLLGAPGSFKLLTEPTTPVCAQSLPITPGASSILAGEPAITTDQDFGTVQYGDPFPSTWPRIFTFCETATVPVPIPGSTTPIVFRLVDAQSSSLPSSPISPSIGQVQNPTINGNSLLAANAINAANVTLNWTAPAGKTPTGYKISAFVTSTLQSGVPTYVPGGIYYTAKTTVVLPPLQSGQTYVFLITSVLDGAANFESSPNRSALPTASVSMVSAPVTVNAGP